MLWLATALLSGHAHATNTQGTLWTHQLQAHPKHWITGATGVKVGKANTDKGERQVCLQHTSPRSSLQLRLHGHHVGHHIYYLGRISENPTDNTSRSMMFSECTEQKLQDIIPSSLHVCNSVIAVHKRDIFNDKQTWKTKFQNIQNMTQSNTNCINL